MADKDIMKSLNRVSERLISAVLGARSNLHYYAVEEMTCGPVLAASGIIVETQWGLVAIRTVLLNRAHPAPTAEELVMKDKLPVSDCIPF